MPKKKMPSPRKTSGRKPPTKMLASASSDNAKTTKAMPPKKGPGAVAPTDKERLHIQHADTTKNKNRKKRNIGRH